MLYHLNTQEKHYKLTIPSSAILYMKHVSHVIPALAYFQKKLSVSKTDSEKWHVLKTLDEWHDNTSG